MKTVVLILFLTLASSVQCPAGTTGVMHGYVRDKTGQQVAEALVTATSPSQTCTTYTDKRGFFVCITLSPDVYSVTVDEPGTSGAYSKGVRISSDQTTFLVFQFSPWVRCPTTTRAPMTAGPFTSLDVRRMETYPPNLAPPISLPMASPAGYSSCL